MNQGQAQGLWACEGGPAAGGPLGLPESHRRARSSSGACEAWASARRGHCRKDTELTAGLTCAASAPRGAPKPSLRTAPPSATPTARLSVPTASPTSWCGPATSWASSCSTGRPTCATWRWRACARWPAPSSPTRPSRRISTPSSTPSRCVPPLSPLSVGLPHPLGLWLHHPFRGPGWPAPCHTEPGTRPTCSLPSDGAGRQRATASSRPPLRYV